MRRWLLRTAVAVLLLGATAAATWHLLGPVTVEVTHAVRGPAVEAVYGPGTVEPVVMLPIGPKVIGRIAKLTVDEGDKVSQGQMLAELDNRELAASVTEWESRVRFQETQFRRASELFRTHTGTEAALDQARNELATAIAALERVRRQLAEMTLQAPAEGVIIRRDGEIGQLIQPGATIFWMLCCDSLRVAAEIDEEDIDAVKPGQKVVIRADAFPNRIFQGTVSEITPKGDPVARSFRVRIRLPADTPLKIGMTADCNIILAERQDALLIPAAAVVDGKVWLVTNGTLSRRPVTLGVSGERMVEVKAGLTADDVIVAQPNGELRDGRAVRVTRQNGSS